MLGFSKKLLLTWGVFCLAILDFYLRSYISTGNAVCNTGFAWGFALPHVLLQWGSGFLLIFIGWSWYRAKKPHISMGFLLILTGGLVNFIDRIVWGCVRDYWNLPFLPIFPTFNLADIMLTLGAASLILGTFQEAELFSRKKA